MYKDYTKQGKRTKYYCCFCKNEIEGDLIEFGAKGQLQKAHEECLVKNTNLEYFGTKKRS